MEKSNQMNRKLVFVLFSVVLFFSACKKDDLENHAGIKLYNGVDFVISSIQYGSENQIYCIAKTKNTDSTVLLTYSNTLELINTTRINEINGLEGELTLKYLPRGGWFITSVEQNYDFTTLTAFLTDKKFTVLEKKDLIKIPNPPNYPESGRGIIDVFDQKMLSDGDFVITCDTVFQEEQTPGRLTSVTGMSIIRLSPDLELRFPPFSGKLKTRSWEPRISELEDGSLFYIRYSPLGRRAYGIIEKSGTVRYEKLNLSNFIYSDPINLSKANENVILAQVLNNDQLQQYTLIDPNSGDVINKSILEKNTTNDGHLGPNPLPNKLEQGSGHFIYSEGIQKLFFLEVDAQAILTKRFEVVMPEFDEILSYRQLFTPEGNVLLAVSFESEGSLKFMIQEYTPEGEQLDWTIKK